MMNIDALKEFHERFGLPWATRNKQGSSVGRKKEVVERIIAMQSHEKTTLRCIDYLTPEVNATCRRLMVDWCFTVVDAFALSRETVGVAMSILDRYLSSGRGKSNEAVKCRMKFQRMVITTLFMAIKIHEPSVLGIQLLVKLTRGVYTESDIIATELEILQTLEWRVYIASTSPMEYVRQYVALLPEEYDGDADLILEYASRRVQIVTSDIYFSMCRASSVGMACLAGALDDMWFMTLSDREAIWTELSSKLDLDIASNEIRQVEKRLRALEESSSYESKRSSLTCLPRSSVISTEGHASSPYNVIRMNY